MRAKEQIVDDFVVRSVPCNSYPGGLSLSYISSRIKTGCEFQVLKQVATSGENRGTHPLIQSVYS